MKINYLELIHLSIPKFVIDSWIDSCMNVNKSQHFLIKILIKIIFELIQELVQKAYGNVLNWFMNGFILLFKWFWINLWIDVDENQSFSLRVFEKLLTWIDSCVFLQNPFCDELISESIRMYHVKLTNMNRFMNQFIRLKLAFIKFCHNCFVQNNCCFSKLILAYKTFNFHKIGLKQLGQIQVINTFTKDLIKSKISPNKIAIFL